MIKTALFDVDGVLAIGTPFSAYLANNYNITPAQTTAFFQERFLACLVGAADLKEELAIPLLDWKWPGSIDDFMHTWFLCEHQINEPLIAQVQQLRQQGIHCYIATNQEKYRTAYLLDQMGFAHSFDGIFSSAYIGSTKPSKSFFSHILRELATIEANNILFWDDTLANITAARELGLHAELYCGFADFTYKLDTYLKMQ